MNKIFLALIILILISCKESPNLNYEQEKEAAWNRVTDFWTTWATLGDTEKLQQFFTEKTVSFSPSDSFRVYGIVNNSIGYSNFINSTQVLNWKLTDQIVDLYGNNNFAVTTFYYEIDFIAGTDTLYSKGRDMTILVKENNIWKIAADKFSNYPKK